MNPNEDKPSEENSSASSKASLDDANLAPTESTATPQQDAPADALSRTPDELAEEEASVKANEPDSSAKDETKQKKVSPIKRFFRKVNVYLLIFILLVVVGGAVTIVYYLNSQKEPEVPGLAAQELTAESLRQLANSDASVGNPSQTLTIQGNAIIDGQTLMRGNLNVAGNIQAGGKLQAPELTIAGSVNLGDTQTNTLQVASNAAVQGSTSLRDLGVSGASSFGGDMTASQITVTRLILSGDATLQIPNHISFTGPAPSRSIDAGTLGNGGSASVDGSDTTGTININTGNNPNVGCFIRINFNQAFSKQPHVIISPVSAGASRTSYYVDRDTRGFSVCTSTAAPANQAFAFDYFVTN